MRAKSPLKLLTKFPNKLLTKVLVMGSVRVMGPVLGKFVGNLLVGFMVIRSSVITEEQVHFSYGIC